MRTEGAEATSRRERLLVGREELEQLELLASSEHGAFLHRPRPRRPGCEGRHAQQKSKHGDVGDTALMRDLNEYLVLSDRTLKLTPYTKKRHKFGSYNIFTFDTAATSWLMAAQDSETATRDP